MNAIAMNKTHAVLAIGAAYLPSSKIMRELYVRPVSDIE